MNKASKIMEQFSQLNKEGVTIIQAHILKVMQLTAQELVIYSTEKLLDK